MKKRIFTLLLAVCMILFATPHALAAKSEDIIILYEYDVHCAVDGYAKLAAMKRELSETTAYVGVVSVGDYIQGGSLEAVSQGEYIVNLMNLVGYDAVALGNHEFDYKIPRLLELVDRMNTKPVCRISKEKTDEIVTTYIADIQEEYQQIGERKIGISQVELTTVDENGERIIRNAETNLGDFCADDPDWILVGWELMIPEKESSME